MARRNDNYRSSVGDQICCRFSGKKDGCDCPSGSLGTLLASWKELVEQLEYREDIAIFQEWLQKRADGEVETISLDALEQELIGDGLV